ncbi:hypothetical protein AJ79_04907 [Helicocarpus griseus UAMH5409]|uniref:Kelch repeat protein n=1 Tax=Helicocarpus griseus UAMH5409 TaxID=1447875 RepID=A0A2B7XQE2_9EURO|nr:hypothetical protein AJ79_04907 [Helicocarpus griseus UAMH5409]
MNGLAQLLLAFASITHLVVSLTDIPKREVLTDLSKGFCRSYKFSANIAKGILYLTGLDGGLIPGDSYNLNNYIVELDLTRPFSVEDGSEYKMSLIDGKVPILKDQALWSDKQNTTLFAYGGRGPVRLSGGAHVNVSSIQSAFWIGGYQDSDTTPDIKDKTKIYTDDMIQFNTTSGALTQIESPITPVEQGALVHLPIGELGILIYFGGEVPSTRNGIGATLTPNSWDYVFIYDIAGKKWSKQATTGPISPRTQFCATVQQDPSTKSYQIYVLGGADLLSHKVISDVSYLSIPSFKWYKAKRLEEARLTLTCVAHGRHIIGVGGREAWQDDQRAGCYKMPAFLYDAQLEELRTTFDPNLSPYSVPTAVARDIQKSPYPPSWSDPSLASLFNPTNNNTSLSPTPSSSTEASSANKGGHVHIPNGFIVLGALGGAATLAALIFAVWFSILRQRGRRGRQKEQEQTDEATGWAKPELPSDCLAAAQRRQNDASGHELDGRVWHPTKYELDVKAQRASRLVVHELP